MGYEVDCICGKVLPVSEDMAGSFIFCSCGRSLQVPTLGEFQGQTATAPPLTDSPDAGSSEPESEAVLAQKALAEFRRTLAELTPRVYVTPVLIGLNVLIFVLMVASGVSVTDPTIPDLLRWGANFGQKTTGGEWWRLLTCTFLHIGIVHILLNMWVLATAGPLVERMVGNVGFLALYLVSGLIGSLASLFWNPMLVSAGASGAIFGICGALLGLLLRNRGSVPPLALTQVRNSGLGFLIYNLFFGMMQSNIDSAAHIGGLAGGFLCGLVLRQPFTAASLPGRPIRNLCVSGLGVVLVAAGMIVITVRHADLGAVVQHGEIEVSYSNGATQAEADRLGAYLAKNWGADQRSSVQLKKTSAGYQFRMVIKKEFQNDPKTLKQLEFEGARVSREIFDGAAVEVHACDELFKTLQVSPPRADIRYSIVEGKAEVFFSADVDKGEAQRFARYIAREVQDAPALVTFKFAQRGAIREVHMGVRPEMVKDPAFNASLRQDRKNLSVEVFKGASVELHLCDELLNVVRVLEP